MSPCGLFRKAFQRSYSCDQSDKNCIFQVTLSEGFHHNIPSACQFLVPSKCIRTYHKRIPGVGRPMPEHDYPVALLYDTTIKWQLVSLSVIVTWWQGFVGGGSPMNVGPFQLERVDTTSKSPLIAGKGEHKTEPDNKTYTYSIGHMIYTWIK